MDAASEPREPTLAEVLRRLESLDRRVAALERRDPRAIDEANVVAAEPAGRDVASSPIETADWLPLIGRTFLVLGGAFVLRSITDAGLLAPVVGVALGVAYALVWLVLADRAASRQQMRSATWHGVAASIVAYPLLWEATVKFGFLDANGAAAAVAGVTGVALAVAWRQRFGVLAWLATVAAVATAAALSVGTRLLEPWAAGLLLLGLATLWLGYTRSIRGPMWLGAAAAFTSILLVTLVVVVADPDRRAALLDEQTVIVLQLSLLVIYVGSAITRTLTRRRALRTEEIALGIAATAVGLGGAAITASATGIGMLWLALISTALGLAGYWAAFAWVDREASRTNFVFFSSLALVFVLVGGGVLLTGVPLVAALAVASVAIAWIGARRGRATLSLHGAVYATAGAIASGMIVASVRVFVQTGFGGRAAITLSMAVALLATLLYCAIPAATQRRTWGRLTRLPKAVVLTLATVGIAGFATMIGMDWLPRAAGETGPDPGALAVLRTGVLALTAVALAGFGRLRQFREVAWLVYPLLVAGGLKLLVDDLRVGKTTILVASFALYGGALILAPRWVRAGRKPKQMY